MSHYETLFLAKTEITDDEISVIEHYLDKQLANIKGKLSVFDKWGKYRLAYPVNKSNYGVYILARYEIEDKPTVKNFMKELDTFIKIKCNEFIMRYVNTKLSPDAPTAYIKPDSIDTSRSTNVDKFVREHKMEGILNSNFKTSEKIELNENKSTTENKA